MGIQINGQTDTISATDGGLIVSGAELPTVSNLNATGISTFNSGIRVIGVGSSVGIGTNNPAEQLELSAGSERLMIGANSPSTYSRIAARNVTNTGYRGFQIDGSDLLINSNTSGNVLLGNGGGNIGVGTDNPADSSKLHVQGGGGLLVRRSAGTSIARFGNTASASPNITVFGSSTTNEPYIGCSTNDLTLGTGNAERARIDSSGRLLVGAISSINDNEAGVGYANKVQIESSSANEGLTVRNIGNVSRLNIVRLQNSMTSGTHVGYLGFGAHSASGPSIERARISGYTDTSGGAGGYGGRLSFETSGDGSASTTIRLSIFRDGVTEISGTFRPTADNSYNLGGSGQRWATVYAANGTINTSDGREKTNINDSILGAEFIKSLRPVSYKWIEGGKIETDERDENNNIVYESVPGKRTHWGFIAQEVKEVVDAAGVDFGGWILTDSEDPDSQQGLRYDQFIAPLTKALQEALEEIETLKTQNTTLQQQNAAILARLDAAGI